ncbi:LysR family transcriptional regulator [Pseudomonas sp. TH08]|uniref:LysR family transcriptional regulator n=1 Tax=unclassified Pseudomonas TaxID=196821 RepID=UPI0019142ADB|nr:MULTISPECIES: LysR family transcriptional regulator [unclassified Pseudomonas]MBK5526846.1 LysR family transcriptional regulator [Pseudomonas sp. TH06]MBK5531895.1 LysR family transcriptional regulator [Pseudomonas sp. TH08]
MNQLLAMRAFRCIVECHGFSAAAERLDTTHSTISRQLQQLEAELGTRLINRNTRRFSLTTAGQQYYTACVDILDRLDQAAIAVGQAHESPSGVLRISAPMVIGTLELANWLPAFQQRYPEIEVDLSCEDRFVDLIAEGFDVALRICGPLADSSLVARLLTVSDMLLVASPAYVARHGLVRQVRELAEHQLLAFTGGSDWSLTDARGAITAVRAQGHFRADSISSLHAAALAGVGIASFTRATVQDDLLSGRLVQILPNCTLGQRHYYALYPHARHVALKVKVLVDFMAEHYRNLTASTR